MTTIERAIERLEKQMTAMTTAAGVPVLVRHVNLNDCRAEIVALLRICHSVDTYCVDDGDTVLTEAAADALYAHEHALISLAAKILEGEKL